MKAVLSTEIPITKMAVFAEMAWMERRPELGLLCRAARKSDNRMVAASIQSLLSGVSEAGARNIIAWCRILELCDEQGALKRLGEDVADTDEAPVPEQGVYALWAAEHPLLGKRILAAERLSSTRDPRYEAIQPMEIIPDKGIVFRSVVHPKERYLLRDFPSNSGQSGALPGSGPLPCRLDWTLDFDANKEQWRLSGAIDSMNETMKSMQHEPESAGIDLWGLAARWGAGPLSIFGRWQVNERRLALALKGLSDREQDTFRKTFKLGRVEVPGKGSYNDVTLEDVPIGPSSREEAQQWSVLRLERRLAQKAVYRSRTEIRRLFCELIEQTPLERFAPILPDHNTLVHQQLQAKKPEIFWSLAAPVDLAPHPVPKGDLDAFTFVPGQSAQGGAG